LQNRPYGFAGEIQMSYLALPITAYLDDLASNKPAPGGGSAAALAGALGAALGSMVANFTVGKEKFAAVEEQVQAALAECERLRGELTALVQADVEAYSKYAAATCLPKNTEEEKARRAVAIQQAMKIAAAVPMEVCRKCAEVLKVSQELLEMGNPNLVSDVGCAAELVFAALRAALLNVEVNHAFIKDPEYVVEQTDELEDLLFEAEQMRDFIWAETRSRIGK
jgi:formiminotetrahydrofolate cyclodeaminase